MSVLDGAIPDDFPGIDKDFLPYVYSKLIALTSWESYP
jgi:hypothetical protein